MFQNPNKTNVGTSLRERILAYGAEKTGKTSAWLSIAQLSQTTGSDSHFYVIDSDCTTDKYLYDPHSPFKGLTNVTVEKAFRWPTYVSAMNKFLDTARPEDWIVLDMATGAWQAVQSHYYDNAYGKTIEEVLLERKKATAGGEDDDAGMKDYQTINPIYFSFILPWSVETPAHIFACAAEKSTGYREKKQVSTMFGKTSPAEGAKPDAQNKLGYQVDTVLRFQCAVPGKSYVMSSIGDRGGRELLIGKPLTNFALDYCVDVAGWTL
jgi:hypothetical protein